MPPWYWEEKEIPCGQVSKIYQKEKNCGVTCPASVGGAGNTWKVYLSHWREARFYIWTLHYIGWKRALPWKVVNLLRPMEFVEMPKALNSAKGLQNDSEHPPWFFLFHNPTLVLWPSWGRTWKGVGVVGEGEIAQVSFHDDTVSIRPIGNLSWHLQGQWVAGLWALCISTSDMEAAEGRGFRPFVRGKATNAQKRPALYILVSKIKSDANNLPPQKTPACHSRHFRCH